ncbi:hypothetical protein [Edaphobacter flagellatus]|uniref:hypothetical protein n=1 Tax=Edaphobacter flagellatus TaxID=1933044 RepID=UPI0021B2D5A1|nr:hypothetical protein [Edaphobacter flagellatus]
MRFERSSKQFVVLTWMIFLLLIVIAVFICYGNDWVQTTREPYPFGVRLKLIGLVLILAVLANLFLRLIPRLSDLRALLAGILVGAGVYWVSISHAHSYLGWNGIWKADYRGFYLLMYEGWGMIFPLLCMGFGVLAALREGMEKRTE